MKDWAFIFGNVTLFYPGARGGDGLVPFLQELDGTRNSHKAVRSCGNRGLTAGGWRRSRRGRALTRPPSNHQTDVGMLLQYPSVHLC